MNSAKNGSKKASDLAGRKVVVREVGGERGKEEGRRTGEGRERPSRVGNTVRAEVNREGLAI